MDEDHSTNIKEEEEGREGINETKTTEINIRRKH